MKKLIIASTLLSLVALPVLAQSIEILIWEGSYNRGYIKIVENIKGEYIGWEYTNDTNNEAGIIICERRQARSSVGDKVDSSLEKFLVQKGCK